MQLTPGYNKANDKVTEMMSMSTINQLMVQEGYTENFSVSDYGMEGSSGKTYMPNEVNVVNFYRFEGDSDPADNAILYVIETDDDTKGTLVNAMGAYADENTARFIQQVGDTKKRMPE